ncbi:MAG: hypothetical protein Q8T13_08095 [Acidobacteriota bacterium]|nr:hypothetical protein [Acidobacteriota bacterium]
MPPRYVYWTIIVDGQPTAFRSGSLEDIMPTFNRLKEKQPNAELKWFQNGQLWPSRHDAQDFMRARGERGRAKDPRQSASAEERPWNAKPEWKTRSTFSAKSDKPRVNRDTPAGERPAWVPKSAAPKKDVASGFPVRRSLGEGGSRSSGDKPAPRASSWGEGEDRPAGQARSDRKPEWKPKGAFKPKEAGHASGWGEKPGWKPKGDAGGKPEWKPKTPGGRPFTGRREETSSADKPEWKPKGTFKPKEEGHRPPPYAKATGGKSARDQARSSFRPKSFTPKVDDGRTRASRVQSRNDKLEWQPKGSAPRPDGPNSGFAKSDPDAPKRKWVPKADYKKSLGIEAKRDDKWRPGGEHKDPKQKYKDAKKAKWTKFKANIRARSTKPRKPKDE